MNDRKKREEKPAEQNQLKVNTSEGQNLLAGKAIQSADENGDD